MATGKKFYWIKIKDSFMTSDKVDFLMSQKNGANYVVLYQMLCLKTINTEGELARPLGEIIMPFDELKIQRDCKYFEIDTIRIALELYKKLGMIYSNDNGILQIADFKNMVGSETDYASQKRIQRNYESKLLDVDISVDNVHIENRDKILDIREEEKEIKEDKDIVKKSIAQVVEYLNSKSNKHFRLTDATTKLIKTRLKEGFLIDDFYRVIDNQCSKWLNDPKMNDYLRPQTLFGTKFESYLNTTKTKKFDIMDL